MNPNIGRTAIWRVKGLNFYVQIVGARGEAGRAEEYRITPLQGTGDKWVPATEVKLRSTLD